MTIDQTTPYHVAYGILSTCTTYWALRRMNVSRGKAIAYAGLISVIIGVAKEANDSIQLISYKGDADIDDFYADLIGMTIAVYGLTGGKLSNIKEGLAEIQNDIRGAGKRFFSGSRKTAMQMHDGGTLESRIADAPVPNRAIIETRKK